MHTDVTAVTTQSNKIVVNEGKDNSARLEPSYEKTKQTFWPAQCLFIAMSSALGIVPGA